jgi:hypothetical protein
MDVCKNFKAIDDDNDSVYVKIPIEDYFYVGISVVRSKKVFTLVFDEELRNGNIKIRKVFLLPKFRATFECEKALISSYLRF